MKLEALKNERIQDFIDYCKKHKSEVDESFLYDEDFKDFAPNEENPTYIVTDEQGKMTAAASVIIDDYNRRGKKGRFRIFHSEAGDSSSYAMLMQAILGHTEGLEKLFTFVPVINEKLMKAIERLKFNVDRYSYLLVREEPEVPEFSLPEGYEIRTFRLGRDEEAWCRVRNESFARLKGSETPMLPEQIAKMMKEDDNIEGGAMLLYHGNELVGVVRGTNDDYEGAPIMNIGPLAIIQEYQGKGLGRSLLRASMGFAREKGYERTVLCVNAENERAKALYIQEGFKQVEAVVCYRYDL